MDDKRDWDNFNWDDEIVEQVRVLQRTYQRVYPWMILNWLPLARVEGSVRRDMAKLWRLGRLERVGGARARRGYRVPKRAQLMVKYQIKKWGEE